MSIMIRKKIEKYWSEPQFILRFIKSACFFSIAITINFFAVRIATVHALQNPALEDTFFSLLPMFDTHVIDYIGTYLLQIGVFLFVLLIHTEYLLFFMNSTTVLILVRDFFVNLTYIGIPEGITPTQSFFTQGGDLFFSGHTALPIMMALVFWPHKRMRYLAIFISLFMGAEVIVGHQHYSIDVFAAPFITYGVYVICKKIFKRDYELIAQN